MVGLPEALATGKFLLFLTDESSIYIGWTRV